jgi:hypothetical protein
MFFSHIIDSLNTDSGGGLCPLRPLLKYTPDCLYGMHSVQHVEMEIPDGPFVFQMNSKACSSFAATETWPYAKYIVHVSRLITRPMFVRAAGVFVLLAGKKKKKNQITCIVILFHRGWIGEGRVPRLRVFHIHYTCMSNI